jgi:hypothetical protein
MLGLCVATAAMASTLSPASCPAVDAASADPCEQDCPGETPEDDCGDDCRQCSCCASVAPSLCSKPAALSAAPLPSRQESPQLFLVAPPGVGLRIFKPPQRA